MREFWHRVGSAKNFTPTELAERALAHIGGIDVVRHRKGLKVRYAVFVSATGLLTLGRPPDVLSPEWVATITRQTNPDVLAEDIAEALA